MKKRINSTVCRLIILIVLISSPVFADDWQVLFDGKTLTGWTEKPKKSSFEVIDGHIVGTMVLNKGTTWLCTDEEFADFELELEVKIVTPDLNSGIQIRSRCKEATGKQQYGAVYGPHVELSTKTANSKSGLVYGTGWKSWITPKETEGNTFMKRGEWNVIRVLAVGKSVKTWINGKFVLETVIPDNRHETNSKGFVALQCADKHGIKLGVTYKIAFKNIRIREIASPGHREPKEREKKEGAKAREDKPNVLFIAIDDLRPELGCYGVDYIRSPRIDAFAKTARLFNNHYVTAPTCGASRYALLTGLSPRNNHEAGNLAFKKNLQFTAQRSIESFPHLFKEAGYETISIGKICHGKQDTLPRSWSRILSPRGNHPEFQNNSGKKQRPAVRGLDLPDAAYQDGAMTDTVIDTLRTLGDDPFFFAVGFTKPHLPFWAPKKYFDLYDAEVIPQAEWGKEPDSPSYHPSFELMQQYGHHPEAGLEDPAYRRHLKHGYAACVSFVDDQIGRILGEVEALGLDNNTIIVLWGDHGWHLGEHRIFGKHTSFEKALKSVLIMRTPGMKNPGRPTDALVQSIDIYPTLAKLCGLTPPKDIDGRTFLDLLNDPNLPGPEYALSYNLSYGAPFRKMPRLHAVSLRSRDYRYIQWQKDLGRGKILFQELYDHRSDPEEKSNLAAKEPKIIKRFAEMLMEHVKTKHSQNARLR